MLQGCKAHIVQGLFFCSYLLIYFPLKVLLKLPAGPLDEFIKTAPEFKDPLAKAAKPDKKSIPKAVLKVLGFDEPEEQA